MNREIRQLPLTELRVAGENNQRKIVGYSAVFGTLSEVLGGYRSFKEKIQQGAFAETIVTDDIRALFNHNRDCVLGRNTSGTLTLTEDEKGLLVEITPPDTSTARDLLVSIERGDVSQMSFGFIAEEDEWGEADGMDIRTLKKVKLFDVSVVTYPAYVDTSVDVRSIDSYKSYQAQIDNEKRENQGKIDVANRYAMLKIM